MKLHEDLIKESRWQTIILLDACRWDAFAEVNTIKGNLQKANSQAFNTTGWYQRHWNKETARDVVLISAQPMAWWVNAHKNFHDSVKVEAEKHEWMHPKHTIDKAIEFESCEKKLLVHLIPPHLPFQGEKGKAFLERIGATQIGKQLWDTKFGPNNIQHRIEKYGQQNGWDELKEYYKENIEFALPHVQRYIDSTKRKVVVTADHGDLIGEDNLYGHTYFSALLTEVPWLEIA